jgi:hypothetical protein
MNQVQSKSVADFIKKSNKLNFTFPEKVNWVSHPEYFKKEKGEQKSKLIGWVKKDLTKADDVKRIRLLKSLQDKKLKQLGISKGKSNTTTSRTKGAQGAGSKRFAPKQTGSLAKSKPSYAAIAAGKGTGKSSILQKLASAFISALMQG